MKFPLEDFANSTGRDFYFEPGILFAEFNGTFSKTRKVVDFEMLKKVDRRFGSGYIALGVTITIVNLFLIAVVLLDRKLRKTQVNLLIVNMAVSHLLMGVLNAPFIGRALVSPYHSDTWGIEENICWFLSFMWCCMMITPIWSLVVLNFDRMSFINVMSPYIDAVDNRMSILMLCFPWCMGVVGTLVLKVAFMDRSRHTCIFWYNTQTLHVIWLVLDYGAPAFIALATVIWIIAMHQQNRRHALETMPAEMRHEVNQTVSLQSTVVVCFASLTFIIFQLPTNIPTLFQDNCGQNLITCSIVIHLTDMSRFFPALLTPFIWLVFPDIRESLMLFRLPVQYCTRLFHRHGSDNDSVPLQRLPEEADNPLV